MDVNKYKRALRLRRHRKVRAKITGTSERPRLAVFRGLRTIYVQLIDDSKSITLASVHSNNDLKKFKGTKVEAAFELGKLIAEKAKALKLTEVVFDRGGYLYHGRVKAIAEGAREAGLKI